MVLQGYQVELVPIQSAHLEQLRQWRNSQEIAQYMLSQDSITPSQQQTWFLGLEHNINQHHFSIMYKDQLIGSANIKAPKNDGEPQGIASATCLETGLYIGEEKYRGNLLAFSPSLLLNDYCFNQLGVEKLTAFVHPENKAAIQYNLKLGYVIESTVAQESKQEKEQGTENWIDMILTSSRYDVATQAIKGLLNRPKRR